MEGSFPWGAIPGHSSVVDMCCAALIQYVQPLLTGLTDDKQAQAHDQKRAAT